MCMKNLFTKRTLLLIFTSVIFQIANAQVGISTTSPEGALDIVSTTGGLVPPRMTQTQRDALDSTMTPKSTVIFNTTSNNLEINTGTNLAPIWSTITTKNSINGSSIAKIIYSASAGDSAKTVTIDDLTFRFSTGILGITRPQVCLTNSVNKTIYTGTCKQLDPSVTTFLDYSLTFTTGNYNVFQNLTALGTPLLLGELSTTIIVDATENKLYKVTFYVNGPALSDKNFVIIAESF